jgi:hypothetical protein
VTMAVIFGVKRTEILMSCVVMVKKRKKSKAKNCTYIYMHRKEESEGTTKAR